MERGPVAHGNGSLFKQELSMLAAHHQIANFTTRATGGYLLEIDFSELVSKCGGKSFSVVAIVPEGYPNSVHKPMLMPVDRDGSVGRELLVRIGESLADSVQVAPGCPAILCAISGVACILRDAAAADNGRAICEKAQDPMPHLTQFMQSEPQRKRTSDFGSSSADTTASSCRSIKIWIGGQPQRSPADSDTSDSSDSDSSTDTVSEDDDEIDEDQVKWQLATNITQKIMRMKVSEDHDDTSTKHVQMQLAANISRQILRMKECRMAKEA